MGRIFLLPVSTRRILTYCERLSLSPKQDGKPPFSERIITKANDTWISWEKAKDGWRFQVVKLGNSLFRRIDFAEYNLRSFPPGTNANLASIKAQKLRLKCYYPAAFIRKEDGSRSTGDSAATAANLLEKMATERQNLHKRRLLYSLIAMPISAPFMIVPVIPNLPFYWVAYRAFCNFYALYGAKTLAFLLQTKAVDFCASERLDQLYATGLSGPASRTVTEVAPATAQEVEEAADRVDEDVQAGKEVLLLRRWNGDLLAEELKLPEMEVEIERAVEQVDKALRRDAASNDSTDARKSEE